MCFGVREQINRTNPNFVLITIGSRQNAIKVCFYVTIVFISWLHALLQLLCLEVDNVLYTAHHVTKHSARNLEQGLKKLSDWCINV